MGTLGRSERIVPVQKRGESVEQGGQFFVLEQTRGDDELTGSVGNQRRIGLDQPFDLRFRDGCGGRFGRDLVRLSGWGFRSHIDLPGSDVRYHLGR